jgi:hypothetical protein
MKQRDDNRPVPRKTNPYSCRRWLTFAVAAVVVGGQAGCTPPPPKDSDSFKTPCGGSPASVVHFARPYLFGGTSAPGQFSTTGGTVFVQPDKFARAGVFDVGDRMITAISVGPLSTLPTSSLPTPGAGVIRISLHEREYGHVELPAGQYWLVSSNIAQVQIMSCTPGALTEIHGGPAATTPTPASS